MKQDEKQHKPDDQKSEYERLRDEDGHEKGAPMAPHQNRPPTEQHRSGPLPNQKK
jgi:hypothetical protein